MVFDSSKKSHQPGEPVPTTGIYKVVHHGHRESHEVVLRLSDRFPFCQQCGSQVRFELVHAADEPAGKAGGGLQ
jgi:hypothetical protein